ncbi:MAG: DUF692 domain-containing protein [Alphaproteobacteria bacterium]|nr:DUF692 domain-containing protein [Alphaproteobacteria bacterium]
MAMPKKAGVGLKADHYHEILEQKPSMGWFEVHPENYMGAGGPPHSYLTRIRENYPLSIHGVGLSIGGAQALDIDHLDRLKTLIDRYQPELFSEHLAWSTHTSGYFNDLLAAPYTKETLDVVCAHVDQIQSYIGRQMLLENPSTYIVFQDSTYSEIDFITEIARRTGCGLLLDVNNVYVSCVNHNQDAHAYIDAFPIDPVGEIHLAGHAEDFGEAEQRLLIDAHDRPVIEEVWQLYEHTLGRTGTVPTLIEWDNNIPIWAELAAEAQKADAIMERITGSEEIRDVA